MCAAVRVCVLDLAAGGGGLVPPGVGVEREAGLKSFLKAKLMHSCKQQVCRVEVTLTSKRYIGTDATGT
jgi:hypothetical protein